jgi:hypothetical protein
VKKSTPVHVKPADSRPLRDEDRFFLECCLEELRDGETVTIFGPLATRAREWMKAKGATERELARLVEVRGGRAHIAAITTPEEGVSRRTRGARS